MQFFVFTIGLILYFSIHSLLANQQIKTWLLQNLINRKYYRMMYNLIAIIGLILIFFLYQKIDSTTLFDKPKLSLLGGLLTFLGIVMNILAIRQYNLAEFSGVQQYQDKKTENTESLRTTGFNAIVRHPLYFATLILLWGYFLFRPTDTYLLLALITSGYIYVGAKLEEQKLVRSFGEAYLNYQKKVPMLIPFIF